MIPPAVGRRPSAALPLAFLGAAGTAFVLAALGVVWLAPELGGHYYAPRVVALTHTVTLGWITLAIIGASYQLVPIVLERPVWSERAGWWVFWLGVVSVAGMVAHFALATWPGLVAAAMLLATAVAAHLVNLTMTARGGIRLTLTTRLAAMGYAGLALTVAFGLLLGAHRLWTLLPGDLFGTLHAHFHLALLGWIAPMVFGASARVYPMFLLAPEPRRADGLLTLWGLGLGVPALVLGLLAAPGLVGPASLLVAVAVGGHLASVWRAVRQARRPALDWGLRFVLTGAGCLGLAALAGLGFAWGALAGPRLGLAYATLALGGWVSFTILGMMLKIVPFLVWYRVYGPRVGRAPVPALADLGSAGAEAWAYALLLGGLGALTVAVAMGEPAAIRAAGVLCSLGALAWASSLGRTLGHLVPRRDRALAGRPGEAQAA